MQRDVIAPAPHPQVVTAVYIERIRAHRSGLSVFRLWINYCVRLARSPLTQTLFHHSPLWLRGGSKSVKPDYPVGHFKPLYLLSEVIY